MSATPTAADLERVAADHLSRVNGARELQAAVLALLLPPGSQRAARVWQVEAEGTPGAEALLAQIGRLGGPSRLPWFETLVSRMRGQPLEAREALLEATRRVMSARGVVRPIDRLHWLAMRQRLGGSAGASAHRAAAADLSELPQTDVSAIAAYSAYLSRIVPIDTVAATHDAADSGIEPASASAPVPMPMPAPVPTPKPKPDTAPGLAWYDDVMAPWRANASVAPCRPPDTDGLVHALQELQALPWMQRPMLVRGWVGAALVHSRYGRLGDDAADALRLSCALLDSPMPPELERHYGVMASAR